MDLIKLLEFMDEDDEEIVWPRVYLADVSNPMELLTDSEFTARYRFSEETVRDLHGTLKGDEEMSCSSHALPSILGLLCALRFICRWSLSDD